MLVGEVFKQSRSHYLGMFIFFFLGGDGGVLNRGTRKVKHLLQGCLKWRSNFAISVFVNILVEGGIYQEIRVKTLGYQK